jgi:hypothetical protein
MEVTHTVQWDKWLSTWLVFLGCLIVYLVLFGVEAFLYGSDQKYRHGLDHRLVDIFFYLSAAAVGIAFGHALLKQSMAKTTAQLRDSVNAYLDDLSKESEQRRSSAKTEPLPLPIPYIVSRLRDKDDRGFGYFGAKLVNRDPRLLLDLALDEALPPDCNDKIWIQTQQIKEANRAVEPSAAAGDSAEKVAQSVVDNLFTRLRPEAEAAVKEALKKAQQGSDEPKPGGSHGQTK